MATAKKSTKITLFNPSQMPVVYTGDGRILAGGERVEVDSLDAAGEEVVRQNYLINETEQDAQRKKSQSAVEDDGASTQGPPA